MTTSRYAPTTESLERLPTRLCAAFGAACCARLLPSDEHHARQPGWGRVTFLRWMLGLVWSGAIDREEGHCRLVHAEQDLVDVEPVFEWSAAGQNAAYALGSMVDFLLDDRTDHILQVACRPFDAIELQLRREGITETRGPALGVWLAEHPWMRQERQRQARDLGALLETTDAAATMVTLREQTRDEYVLELTQ